MTISKNKTCKSKIVDLAGNARLKWIDSQKLQHDFQILRRNELYKSLHIKLSMDENVKNEIGVGKRLTLILF